MLVCGHPAGRSAITRNGVTRYVPVYPSIRAAIDAASCVDSPPLRRRARAELPAQLTSLRRARELVTDWLTVWSQPELIPVAKVVVTAFVENVLQHTDSRPGVRLEYDGSAVTVAVSDASHLPAGPREEPKSCAAPSGLHIVSALSRAWGNAPIRRARRSGQSLGKRTGCSRVCSDRRHRVDDWTRASSDEFGPRSTGLVQRHGILFATRPPGTTSVMRSSRQCWPSADPMTRSGCGA